LQGEKLKEHITKTPALLICVEGEVIFENENGIKEVLLPGDLCKH
jgi:quercetin dioxygenase-like cupin family protein